MSDHELPPWLQRFVDEEVRAGRAASAADVVLEGEMLSRAMAWLEDRIYDGLDIDVSDRIDGKRFMLDLTKTTSENFPPDHEL
jgi:Arc/MetJ-type ribon-helix-helix transcriptional regulator